MSQDCKSHGAVYSTFRPDIRPLEAFVKVNTWQFDIIPAVTVQMETPWIDSVGIC